MIVVTGASGHLGSGVINSLLARISADQIVASVRDPAALTTLAERGVTVRAGNFDRPDKLARAFAGARQALVISVNQFGEAGRRLHGAAFEAARAAGVGRLLYTSHMGARSDGGFAHHSVSEAMLVDTGVPFTALRHGFYAESALNLIGRGFDTGEIRAPEDGPVSWTARADLAEADAAVLADEGRFDGISPPLTALEAFDMADIAALASELTGREIRRVVIPDDEWLGAKVAEGLPLPVAQALLAMYRSARRGDLAATDPTLEGLLGRTPLTMRNVLATTLRAG